MKLISLNTWGARVYQPLIEFVGREKATTDIFCFQEVYHTTSNHTQSGPEPQPRIDGLARLTEVLTDGWRQFYSVGERGFNETGKVDFHLEFGNATFVRTSLPLLEQDEIFVYQGREDVETHREYDQPRVVQISQFQDVTIINFHGLWQKGTNKVDTPERIEQSKKLRAIMDRYPTRLIVTGDFNLLPDTESLAILERGMINLIKAHGVTSTRSSHYEKPVKFADYMLVSPDINVNEFKVLADEVSDHLPLLLNFS